MFKWLEGQLFYSKDFEEFEIQSFNTNINKFECVNVYNNEKVEFMLKETNVLYHFTSYDDWEVDLYNKLEETGNLTFHFISLDSNDAWLIEMNKTVKDNVISYEMLVADESVEYIKDDQLNVHSFKEWVERFMQSNNAFTFLDIEGILIEESFLKNGEASIIYGLA